MSKIMQTPAMLWTLDDNTNGKSGGYLQLRFNGIRVADFFPYAKSADEQWVREQAQLIVDTMNRSPAPASAQEER